MSTCLVASPLARYRSVHYSITKANYLLRN